MLSFPQVVSFECLEKIRKHLVSADFKGASKFVSDLKFCLYHVHDEPQRDLEILGGLELNATIKNQCSICFKTAKRSYRRYRQRETWRAVTVVG